nr:class I SAM-dependent methyltransferase [Paenibacillus caui]
MYLSPHLYHRIVRPRWFTNKYIHEHIKKLTSLENRSVLDFGCGTGANCTLCDADRYYGLDPDAQRIQFARRLHPKHIFMVFDEERIPIPDQFIDLILVIAVLHHIPNEQITAYLQEFRRVLKPGGKMIIIEPYLSPRHKFNNWFMNRYDDGEFIRSEDDYLQLFQGQQFEHNVIKKFRKCFFYNEILFTAAPEGSQLQDMQAKLPLSNLRANTVR